MARTETKDVRKMPPGLKVTPGEGGPQACPRHKIPLEPLARSYRCPQCTHRRGNNTGLWFLRRCKGQFYFDLPHCYKTFLTDSNLWKYCPVCSREYLK